MDVLDSASQYLLNETGGLYECNLIYICATWTTLRVKLAYFVYCYHKFSIIFYLIKMAIIIIELNGPFKYLFTFHFSVM